MPTIAQALAAARRSVDAVDARVLMCHVLARDAAYVAAHGDVPLDAETNKNYVDCVTRRARGEPVAYITGQREFYGLPLHVSPAVLIPRPETELLVELVLERIPAHVSARVLDLGTGSGCIALAIAKARPVSQVCAVDRSHEAIAIARGNAHRLGIGNVAFFVGDWLSAVGKAGVDLIVANPPYVAREDPHLRQGDVQAEPRIALDGGIDGLDAIRAILFDASTRLRRGGTLLFEHGYDQAAACRNLLLSAGFEQVGSWRDLAGIERVSGGVRLDASAYPPLNFKVE
jgi:release factor glutamine methyltransferase